MRIADIAIFMFIFQGVLGVLNGIDFLQAGSVSTHDVSADIEHVNETVKNLDLDVECSDFLCSVVVTMKQIYYGYIVPFGEFLWAFSKGIFIGEFLRDLFRPLDPGNSLDKLYLFLDGVGAMIFTYGVMQFLRGVGFKIGR